LKVKKKVRISF